MKLTKEDIDKVRNIEGFPIAKDEDIIALSNPPYYTACPNPFIGDFIKKYGKPYDEDTDNYHREPFAADISEGKNDAIYNAHSYHTKVPYKAIMRYILHYTEPDDIILDGFCGTGMTGIAAQMCGNPEPVFKFKLDNEMTGIKWGSRNAILNDLSPAATFISNNYNTPIDIVEFVKEATNILKECEKECSWMYETKHIIQQSNKFSQMKFINSNQAMGRINYTVWSDVFICPNCGKQIVFWDVAFDKNTGKVKNTFKCLNCGIELKKNKCKKSQIVYFDDAINDTISLAKQVPVLINYTIDGKHFEKKPDAFDLKLINKIDKIKIPYWYPKDKLPEGYNTEQPKRSHKIMYVHQFYTKRTLYYLSKLYNLIQKTNNKSLLTIMFTSQLINISKLNRYRPQVSFPYNPLSGTLYISSIICESNVYNAYKSKIRRFSQALKNIIKRVSIISTNSTVKLNVPKNTIDYIFTDPPFGGNLNYSELSFIWESWLKVKTNNKTEAIINNVQKKGIVEYQDLITKCFYEYFRVLKPNRWITVEFHNSKNSVWNAIQEAISKAGFIIADVRTLDKKQGSFKQVTTTTAVKQDLVISAYKPKESFRRKFLSHAGSEETAWDFIRQHLDKLPVVVKKNNKIEMVEERQAFLLFDRMVAYHIMNGIPVPIDAADFYKGLDERFLKRDGMYFLQDQISEYDTARIKTDIEPIQLTMMINDEKTAIAWLYQQLTIPQTYAEIQPKFMHETHFIEKYEKRLELSVLLEENFLQDDNGRWYIPDIKRSADVVKLREKRLLKEFDEYLNSTGKLKLFRAEAIRAGFAKLWKDKNYDLIVKTAERLPESVIQEDEKLLMYYDASLNRRE